MTDDETMPGKPKRRLLVSSPEESPSPLEWTRAKLFGGDERKGFRVKNDNEQKKNMNIKNHINLIKNHGYKGKIGIAKETIRGLFLAAKQGDVILFRPYEVRDEWNADEESREWDRTHCSIETPMSEEQIQEQKAKGSGLTTYGTCVGVPLSMIEELVID